MDRAISSRLETIEKEVADLLAERRTLLKQSTGEVVEDYEFISSEGVPTRLSEIFGEKNELILIHNMGKGCVYCTLWADGFNGVVDHLQSRAALALVSPNRPEMQKSFADSRGWNFPMFSSSQSSFTRDMGYEVEQDGATYYHPGVSVFTRDSNGSIRRVGRDFFGPGDMYAGIWHLFELLPNGPGDWSPKYSYSDEEQNLAKDAALTTQEETV